MEKCPQCDRPLAGDICPAHGYVGAGKEDNSSSAFMSNFPSGAIMDWAGTPKSVPNGWKFVTEGFPSDGMILNLQTNRLNGTNRKVTNNDIDAIRGHWMDLSPYGTQFDAHAGAGFSWTGASASGLFGSPVRYASFIDTLSDAAIEEDGAGATSRFQRGTGAWSFAVNIMFYAIGKEQAIMSTLGAATAYTGIECSLMSDNKFRILISQNYGSSQYMGATTQSTASATTWYTLVFCYSGSPSYYRSIWWSDASAVSSGYAGVDSVGVATSAWDTSNANALHLGARPGGSIWLHAAMTWCAMWNRYLTEQECSDLAVAGQYPRTYIQKV